MRYVMSSLAPVTDGTRHPIVTESHSTLKRDSATNGGSNSRETLQSMQGKHFSKCSLAWYWGKICAFFSVIGNCICSLFGKTSQKPASSTTSTTPSSQPVITTPESTPTVDLSPLTEAELQKERDRLNEEHRILVKEKLPKMYERLDAFYPPADFNLFGVTRFTPIDPKKKTYCYYLYKASELARCFFRMSQKVNDLTTQNTRKEFEDNIAAVQSALKAIDTFFTGRIKEKLTAKEEDELWELSRSRLILL